ncbi:elongation factor G [Planctellipticum variicoloris]|uniref:elongation factor G n=1 Tax=Planctellipticum variicoloris TaxID=3064265 RepID=UPI003013F146|nr:elongation factor G [Planctomycetaceae bacterium SH412]
MAVNLSLYRNIGVSAHIDSGKTTLSERILFYCGRIHSIHEVKGKDGVGAVMDHMELEREKGITITSAATQVTWKDYTVNVIDTPGHVDFTVEVERSLRVLDGAILVLCSVGGVQSQSLTVDRQMKRYKVPRIAFINKMDRTGANPDKVITQIREKLNVTPVPLQIPMGREMDFQGVIDLIEQRAVFFDGEDGEVVRYEPIPEQFQAKAAEARQEMLEALSMFSDDLMTALLEEQEIGVEEIRKVVRQATLAHQITPVMMGSAYKNKGVQELLDGVTYFLPSPIDRELTAIDLDKKPPTDGTPTEPNWNRVPLESTPDKPLVCMAFKTVVEQYGQLTYTRLYQGKIVKGDSYINTRTGKRIRFGRLVRMHSNERQDVDSAEAGDIIALVGVDCASGDTFCSEGTNYALESIFVPDAVIRLSIEPVKRDGADRLGKALERFRREDPTFRVMTDEETGQTLIAGMGQLHLDIYVERIKREYGVECIVGQPRVAYRECPTRSVEFNYKHKKQTGGSGQFAHVVGVMEPLPEDAVLPYEFVNEVSGGRIPKEYIAPVDKGFQRALVKGPLCECEVVGVRMRLQDGSYHDVDSSEMAFDICGFDAMREVLGKADLGLLEPIMKLEVEVPDEYQGGVTGHLASKRGVINSSDTGFGIAVINAEVPLSSMFDYANELRSMTQGKGTFTMEFAKYAMLPRGLQAEVVEKRRKEKAERAAAK